MFFSALCCHIYAKVLQMGLNQNYLGPEMLLKNSDNLISYGFFSGFFAKLKISTTLFTILHFESPYFNSSYTKIIHIQYSNSMFDSPYNSEYIFVKKLLNKKIDYFHNSEKK